MKEKATLKAKKTPTPRKTPAKTPAKPTEEIIPFFEAVVEAEKPVVVENVPE
jgi:hypothetical protein